MGTLIQVMKEWTLRMNLLQNVQLKRTDKQLKGTWVMPDLKDKRPPDHGEQIVHEVEAAKARMFTTPGKNIEN